MWSSRDNAIMALALTALVFCTCSRGEKMGAQTTALSLDPPRAPMNDMTVTAQIELDEARSAWQVVVVFTRPPTQAAMKAADVEVEMTADDGEPLRIVQAPDGDGFLPEVGDPRAISVNARYLFARGASRPSRLVIRHGGEELSFRLLPAEGTGADSKK